MKKRSRSNAAPPIAMGFKIGSRGRSMIPLSGACATRVAGGNDLEDTAQPVVVVASGSGGRSTAIPIRTLPGRSLVTACH
jgi:hypothetical protein